VYIWHKEKLFDDENGLWHLTYTQKERKTSRSSTTELKKKKTEEEELAC